MFLVSVSIALKPASRFSGNTQAESATLPTDPKCSTAICPTPSENCQDGIGSDSTQVVRRRPLPRSESSVIKPLEITWYFTGAVTVIVFGVLTEIWSIVASQLRALLGQLSV